MEFIKRCGRDLYGPSGTFRPEPVRAGQRCQVLPGQEAPEDRCDSNNGFNARGPAIGFAGPHAFFNRW